MPGGSASDLFVLSVSACGYASFSSAPHGMCVWDEIWGNGYCDQSETGVTFNSNPAGPWYLAWEADLNCEQAGFGEPYLSSASRYFAFDVLILACVLSCMHCVDGGDCLTETDDPCPVEGWVPICPGTSCPDNVPTTECDAGCYKVPDSYSAVSWEAFIQEQRSRLGDGEYNRQ